MRLACKYSLYVRQTIQNVEGAVEIIQMKCGGEFKKGDNSNGNTLICFKKKLTMLRLHLIYSIINKYFYNSSVVDFQLSQSVHSLWVRLKVKAQVLWLKLTFLQNSCLIS